jgi:Holliday junction resolvase-like predicted endonuclease
VFPPAILFALLPLRCRARNGRFDIIWRDHRRLIWVIEVKASLLPEEEIHVHSSKQRLLEWLTPNLNIRAMLIGYAHRQLEKEF